MSTLTSDVQLQQSLLLRACRREKTERTPVWLMRQAGRYQKSYRDLRARVSMLELCKSPDLVAQVTVEAVRELDVDAAILFSDLLLPVEPLGLTLAYNKGEGPTIRPAVRSVDDVRKLRPVDVRRDLGYVLDAVRATRAALPPHIPLLGFAGAPFTLASYVIEGEGSRNFQATKLFMREQPAHWHRLMESLSRISGDLMNEQVLAGAQAVQMFDSWVGCLSPSDYRTYVLPHSRASLAAVRGAPTIHFATQSESLLDLMKDAGGDVIGVDWRVDLKKTWDRLGDVAVMGNLDSTVLFAAPDVIRRETERVLAEADGRPGHIFNLGHGILPDTPVAHAQSLVRDVKELSAR
jgi:uroporphyrinogen decarboxylase